MQQIKNKFCHLLKKFDQNGAFNFVLACVFCVLSCTSTISWFVDIDIDTYNVSFNHIYRQKSHPFLNGHTISLRLQPPPDSTQLPPGYLSKNSVSFACLCSLDAINRTNGDNGGQFGTVSLRRHLRYCNQLYTRKVKSYMKIFKRELEQNVQTMPTFAPQHTQRIHAQMGRDCPIVESSKKMAIAKGFQTLLVDLTSALFEAYQSLDRIFLQAVFGCQSSKLAVSPWLCLKRISSYNMLSETFGRQTRLRMFRTATLEGGIKKRQSQRGGEVILFMEIMAHIFSLLEDIHSVTLSCSHQS